MWKMYVYTLYVVNKAVTETRLNKSRLFHFTLKNLENYKIKFLSHVLVLITPPHNGPILSFGIPSDSSFIKLSSTGRAAYYVFTENVAGAKCMVKGGRETRGNK